MNKIGTINGHTPVPRDDKRDSTGSGPVVTRQMTEYERAWVDSLKKPEKKVSSAMSMRSRRGQI